ncbi:MAG: photosystem I reaction center subunit XI [Cyanobacteria bacterium P01_G01_bin.54]
MTLDAITSGGDPQVGNLATPINSSSFTKAFINNLPAYRSGLAANRRGLEVGMAHGYLLYGPFALLGPLRSTEYAQLAGLIAAIGLVTILTLCLSIYAGAGSGVPIATLTTPVPPKDLSTKEGWNDFASGFLLGGCGGAMVACALSYVLSLGLMSFI